MFPNGLWQTHFCYSFTKCCPITVEQYSCKSPERSAASPVLVLPFGRWGEGPTDCRTRGWARVGDKTQCMTWGEAPAPMLQ